MVTTGGGGTASCWLVTCARPRVGDASKAAATSDAARSRGGRIAGGEAIADDRAELNLSQVERILTPESGRYVLAPCRRSMRAVPLAGRLRRAIAPALVGCLAGCLAAASCADTVTRNPPVRGSLGTELYGVVCDRVGAQSLHEDLTGASFHAICHTVEGAFASKVDTSQLPPMVNNQPDVHGNPVPLATQQAQRSYGVA